jgi:hypothetical protein
MPTHQVRTVGFLLRGTAKLELWHKFCQLNTYSFCLTSTSKQQTSMNHCLTSSFSCRFLLLISVFAVDHKFLDIIKGWQTKNNQQYNNCETCIVMFLPCYIQIISCTVTNQLFQKNAISDAVENTDSFMTLCLWIFSFFLKLNTMFN